MKHKNHKFHYILILLSLLFMGSCRTIQPQQPKLPQSTINTQPLPPSNIDVPVSIDLTNAFADLEKKIPPSMSSPGYPNNQGVPGQCRVEYRWSLSRSPLAINLDHQNISISSTISYSVNGRARPCCGFLCPWVGVSCGTNGEPPRAITIGISSTLNLANNYQLQTHTSLSELKPLNPCLLSFLNINVTNDITGVASRVINNELSSFDQSTSQISIRPKIEPLWNGLFKPIEVADIGFISINPDQVRLSSLNGNGKKVDFSVGLTAKPIFSLLNPGTIDPKALPNITNSPAGDAFTLYVDGKLQYVSLSTLINAALVKKGHIAIGKNGYINISQAQAYGVGNSKLVFKVNANGKVKGIKYKGWLYLTGTPTYNAVSGEVWFPDIDYSIETKNLPIKILNWLLHSTITDTLRDMAKLNISSNLNDTKQKLQTAMNRQINGNISLQGSVDNLGVVGILPLTDYLLLRANSSGKLKVIIKQ